MDRQLLSCEDDGMHGGNGLSQEIFRTRMPWGYRLGVLLLGAVVTIGVAWGMAADGMNGAVLVPALLAALFLFVALMQVTVRLESTEVSVRVSGIFATRIPYHQIDDVAPGRPTGITAGMGLRILPNSTTGYLVGGPSIRITTGSTAVLVSCDSPEKLSEAIRDRSTSSTCQ